jgi:RNA polymerase sigma factor (sigma-70 family)
MVAKSPRRGTRIPYGAMVNASYELHKAYYYEGYKNDDSFPELPCAPQPDYVCPEEELYRKEITRVVQETLDFLPPRQSKVLHLRYGLNIGYECTLGEIGSVFDLTKERIRQIEIKALRRLSNPELRLQEVFEPENFYETTRKNPNKLRKKNA